MKKEKSESMIKKTKYYPILRRREKWKEIGV
jgi:hypothetical protein